MKETKDQMKERFGELIKCSGWELIGSFAFTLLVLLVISLTGAYGGYNLDFESLSSQAILLISTGTALVCKCFHSILLLSSGLGISLSFYL